jgi:protoporphyrin/coproporphyrin ferrochelatase
MAFLPRSNKIGVIVAQLGTPDAPTAPALRRYLAQFLGDQRVIDISPFVWKPLLHGVILNRRPRRSAKLYRRIWTDAGSPLLVHSREQVAGLQARLGDDFRVILGMRYGSPSIESAMRALESEGIERVLIFPMFPQFSGTTTGAIYDAATLAAFGKPFMWVGKQKRSMPTLRFVPPYFDDPMYIHALKAAVQDHVTAHGKPARYLFSFHGIPRRYVDEGDPYRRQCGITAGLLARALDLRAGEWRVSFQSQFGREEWLQPYTEATLERLGERGLSSLLVTCPGFTADCLETVDEIGNEGYEQFHGSGGGQFLRVPCLNAHPLWLDTMATIVRRETQGWTTHRDRARHRTSSLTTPQSVDWAGAGLPDRAGRSGDLAGD